MENQLTKNLNLLQENDSFLFTYKGGEYTCKCFAMWGDGEKDFSISRIDTAVRESMNVEKITNKSILLYDFNMMGVKSTYKMHIREISNIKPKN